MNSFIKNEVRQGNILTSSEEASSYPKENELFNANYKFGHSMALCLYKNHAYVQHLKEEFEKGNKELIFTKETIDHIIESFCKDLHHPEKLDYHVIERVFPFWLSHLLYEQGIDANSKDNQLLFNKYID